MHTPFATRRLVVALAITLGLATSGLAVAQPSPDDGPFETYVAYLAAVQAAKTIDELAPWLATSSRAMIDETPADEKPMLFGMLQAMSGSIKDVELEGVNSDGATATLEVKASADGKPMTGAVDLVKEDGAWRIVTERWSGGM